MNETIERIAKAICIGLGGQPDAMTFREPLTQHVDGLFYAPLDKDIRPAWQWFVPAAIEVLAAFKE